MYPEDIAGQVVALVGAQYGSEGKGMVAAKLATHFAAHVRTGGPNAGHTFYHEGRKWVARSIPCGWINPDATLYIGPGAVIDPDVMQAEIDEIVAAGYDIRGRLHVDYRATVITRTQHAGEGGVAGRGHALIGSTGEGVGLARMARINRGAFLSDDVLVHATADTHRLDTDLEVELSDVPALLDRERDGILLEGTQGSGLSLTYGPWPHCTSADTNSGQLLVDAGVSPGRLDRTLLVARTFPIRVAGRSGPLPNETDWEAVGVPPEYTTVTGKQRRVAHWDSADVAKAVTFNWPASVVVTFADYLFPSLAGADSLKQAPHGLFDWVARREAEISARIVGVGLGPDSLVWVT